MKQGRWAMKLEAVAINKHFGKTQILHDVSFEVNSKRAMGFLGRNGAGKTTTIRCLMDVFKPDSGQFLLDGKEFDVSQYKIGYLPEERGMYQKNSIVDQLRYFSKLRGATHKQAIETTDYWINRFELNEYRNKKLETLSKGNQQKIQIAQAFLNDPDILILDEPFSGLDPVNSQMFKEVIHEYTQLDKLVIFSSHQMSYVEELCDDIILIHQGRILVNENLNTLKRELSHNKTLLRADNYSTEQLKDLLSDLDTEIDARGLVINSEGFSHHQLLENLLQYNLEISSFGYFEPSLQDIFVKMVGEENA